MAVDGGEIEVRINLDTKALRKGAEESEAIFDEIVSSGEKADANLAKNGFDEFREKATKNFQEFSDKAGDAFVKVVDKADELDITLSSIGQSLGKIGFGALTTGATAAAASLVKMAKGAVTDTSALENVQIQMIGLTHSIEAGNKAMAYAVQYFKNNPFNRFEVTDATKSLIQYGATVDEVPALLDKLGKVSLSTGESINSLATIYQRTVSQGRVGLQDIYMLANRGIGIFDAFAKATGKSVEQVRAETASGGVAVEDFKKAFDYLVDDTAMERFNNTFSRQVDRFKGRLSNLRAELAGYTVSPEGGLLIDEKGLYRAVTRFLKTFSDMMDSDTGKRIYSGFKKIGDSLATVVDNAAKLIEPAGKIIGNVLEFIGSNSELLIPLITLLTVKVSSFASRLPVIGNFLRPLTDNFGELWAKLKGFVSLNPMLSATLGILGVGFYDAYKNSETFRKTIGSIFNSLKTIAGNLVEALRGVFEVITQIIQGLANSGVIQTVLQVMASALSGIAQAIASIPPEMLASLISFFVTFKMLRANPIYLIAAGIGLLVSKIKELGGIAKIFENLPQTLATIGNNLMVGLFNGIQEGAKKVLDFIRNLGQSIVSGLKNVLGIHSPSTVMYGIGENITLGLANGIEDSKSAVQIAMNNLAKDILALSSKVIGNKVSFGLLDYKQQYQEWKKIANMFAVGSEQYNQAIEKMEDARKNANLQILNLQNEYNDKLDETINNIATMYGLLDDVNLKSGKNSTQILKGLDQQVAKMQEWAEAQKMISESNLDAGLVKELQAMGVGSASELSAIANMTADELSILNEMWLKKQSTANDAGVKQMEGLKNETLSQINELKSGIDKETVDVVDTGGRLVSNIAEGVYGAMPTLEGAFNQLGEYVAKAQKELAKGAGAGSGVTGGGANEAPDDIVKGILKQEVNDIAGKIKDFLPNILLGVAGAFGAKWLIKTVANKLSGRGEFAQALAGTLFRGLETKLGKEDLSNIIGKLPYKEGGGFLSKAVGKLQQKLSGGVDETAEEIVRASKTAKSATQPAKVLSESSTVIGNSMETTGKGLSKATSVFDSIKKGAQTVIWIAGAIAAMAGALWITYNALKDIDFLKLAGQLVMMGIAVVEFGALALAANKLKIGVGGILAIAGIAADIALVAIACRVAYEAMKVLDWDIFAKVLGRMFEAIAIFGIGAGIFGMKPVALAEALGLLVIAGIALDIVALSKACREAYDTMSGMDWVAWGHMLGAMINALGVIGGFQALLGLFAPLEFLGWGAVITVCDSLVRISEAIVIVDQKVPEDFESVKNKLKNIKKTLEIINGLDLGTVIGMMVTSWSVGPVERIIGMYTYVAEQLNKISQIELNGDAIDANLNYIQSVLESIKAKNDAISGWLEASALDMEASSVENAGRIVIVYGDMVDALDKLANFTPNEQAITGSLTKMVGVITLLRNSSYGSGGIFNIFSNMGTIAGDVEKIKDIVKNYLEMVPTFQDLGKDENKISDDLSTTVQKNIGNIKDIVYEIASVDTAGYVDTKENDVKKIQSILNNFTEIVPTIQSVANYDTSQFDNAKTKIGKIKEVVLEIGKVDTGGWIDQKESDMNKIQSILNKFTEVAQTTQLLDQYPLAENAIAWVQNVRHLVWEVGQINQSESGSLDAKAGIIEKSKTILTKLMEFSNLMKDFESTDKSGMIQMLTDNLYQLVSNVQNTLMEQASGFENVGSQLGQSLVNGIRSIDFSGAGNEIQSKIWHAIQSRMNDEYNQGRSMGERFRQGLYDIDYGNAGWWAVQGFINGAWGRAGSGDGVYNTGWWIADRFLRGLKDRGEQGSPWKTTIESGNWAVQGLIEGIKQEEDALVTEATSLADQVVNALAMDDLTISPTLGVQSSNAPMMAIGDDYGYGNNGSVIIEQTNNNYTQYDIEQVQRDLAWELAKV